MHQAIFSLPDREPEIASSGIFFPGSDCSVNPAGPAKAAGRGGVSPAAALISGAEALQRKARSRLN